MESRKTDEIPCGFKFEPTDQDLIQYLLCKANHEPLPYEGVVNDCDVYAKEPSQLFEGSEEKVQIRYFFCKLKKKHSTGKRIDRVTSGMGTWKGQDTAKIIRDCEDEDDEGEEKGTVIGAKRSFTYRVKSETKARSGWSMTEFNLDGTSVQQVKDKDYVICRVKRKKVATEAMMMEKRKKFKEKTLIEVKPKENAIIEATVMEQRKKSEEKALIEVEPKENAIMEVEVKVEPVPLIEEPPEPEMEPKAELITDIKPTAELITELECEIEKGWVLDFADVLKLAQIGEDSELAMVMLPDTLDERWSFVL